MTYPFIEQRVAPTPDRQKAHSEYAAQGYDDMDWGQLHDPNDSSRATTDEVQFGDQWTSLDDPASTPGAYVQMYATATEQGVYLLRHGGGDVTLSFYPTDGRSMNADDHRGAGVNRLTDDEVAKGAVIGTYAGSGIDVETFNDIDDPAMAKFLADAQRHHQVLAQTGALVPDARSQVVVREKADGNRVETCRQGDRVGCVPDVAPGVRAVAPDGSARTQYLYQGVPLGSTPEIAQETFKEQFPKDAAEVEAKKETGFFGRLKGMFG